MRSASVFRRKRQAAAIGVVGGGQLAQMLAMAAKMRDVDVVVQTPSSADPAAFQSKAIVYARPEDVEGTSKLVQSCCCITFENEWINIDSLRPLEIDGVSFLPPLSALAPLIDKISQRELLDKLQIPGPDWLPLSSSNVSHLKLPTGWKFPLMAKASKGGYDGKGTRVLNSFKDLSSLLNSVDPEKWLLEKWVKYERELAIVASRDVNGLVRSLPLVETYQTNQICDWVLAPAAVSHDVEVMAYNIAASLLVDLDYVGVLAIEFFYGSQGLQVNEIAPRTHNSAHFSIEACTSSQFDQQICIAAGLPVPEPEMVVPGALMVNLIGLSPGDALPLNERLAKLRENDDVHLHWYEKDKEVPGRKLGHATVLLKEVSVASRRSEASKALEGIRSIWPMFSPSLD